VDGSNSSHHVPRGYRHGGRSAEGNPSNRFERLRLVDDESNDPQQEIESPRPTPTEFLRDDTKSILVENNSPDVPFRWSLNPYRGCEHGCAYCYARPTHEYLGFGAGVDFESKILVKEGVAELLRAELARPYWCGETITLSGVTDCYQPAERRFRLTRMCLEVMYEARQPVGIVTKNALVLRDLDLLAPMAALRLVHVNVSVTTLDAELARTMEPRTSTPEARLRTITELAAAGVPVRVLVAPIIPGLNDHQIADILRAVSGAGARAAGYVLLRLPLSVEPVFRDWLARHWPEKQSRVEALVRQTRAGRLNDSTFGARMRGTGQYAEQIAKSFAVFAKKFGLDRPLPALDSTQFRRPRQACGQLSLF